jgi:hypothetical protein
LSRGFCWVKASAVLGLECCFSLQPEMDGICEEAARPPPLTAGAGRWPLAARRLTADSAGVAAGGAARRAAAVSAGRGRCARPSSVAGRWLRAAAAPRPGGCCCCVPGGAGGRRAAGAWRQAASNSGLGLRRSSSLSLAAREAAARRARTAAAGGSRPPAPSVAWTDSQRRRVAERRPFLGCRRRRDGRAEAQSCGRSVASARGSF